MANPVNPNEPERRGSKTRSDTAALQFTVVESSLGLVLVARTARGVCAVLIGDDRDELRRNLRERFPAETISDGDAEMSTLAGRVIDLIESPAGDLDVPLDVRGTEFQRLVWQALREVPAGSTASYTDIAVRIGLPKSVRAVAQACAANPLAVIVPCHRIVKRDGQLSGYRWGIERKRKLLEKEHVA
ncbi:MAG: methylated-DNA--[protein]-cysteine S-methyltransferase [Gemmatimonadaceae bacterium]